MSDSGFFIEPRPIVGDDLTHKRKCGETRVDILFSKFEEIEKAVSRHEDQLNRIEECAKASFNFHKKMAEEINTLKALISHQRLGFKLGEELDKALNKKNV